MSSPRYSVGTVATSDYIPWSRVLAESVAEHNPGIPVYALILDDFDPDEVLRPDDRFEVIRPADLAIAPDEFAWLSTMYTTLQLSCAMKSWLLLELLERTDAAVYLDSDMRVYDSLDVLAIPAAWDGVVLTPHLLTPPPPDGRFPNDDALDQFGMFNAGCLAAGQTGRPFLRWWAGKCSRDCFEGSELRPPRFVDQRWLDLAPAYFDVTVARDPGVNVAYWNMPERPVQRSDAGAPVIGGRPLRLFHFSALPLDAPRQLNRFLNADSRVRAEDHPVVLDLCEAYVGELRAAGLDPGAERRPPAELAPGVPLSDTTRSALRVALTDAERAGEWFPRRPDDPRLAGDLLDWFTAADTRIPGLTRYLRALHASEPRIAATFPNLGDPATAGAYIEWARTEGVTMDLVARPLLSAIGGAAPAFDDADSVVLVDVDDLLARPDEFAATIATFRANDPVTFLLWWPARTEADLSAALAPVMDACGFTEPDGPTAVGLVDPLPTPVICEIADMALSPGSRIPELASIPVVLSDTDIATRVADARADDRRDSGRECA
ncbi:MAG: hypothetical protein H6531_02525 [Actinobacteria bacterium]|nr:hypothetical protein [Actinomycetota bacterium]